MPNAPADEHNLRFAANVAALTADVGKIGLAVSGGADSVAMLILASTTLGKRVAVATVDHGIRPEGAAEADFVASLCAQLDLPHTTLKPSTPIIGSLQAAARDARYALLFAWADVNELAWIATAHHRDDQAETLMMRLLRGSGLEGLSSIRRINGRIIRPLLDWPRSELRAIVASHGIEPVEDPSNDDQRYDRVRIRSLLAHNAWLDPAALARSASALAAANEAVEWTVKREARRRISAHDDGIVFDPKDLPDELVRRLVQIALGLIDQRAAPRGAQITGLIKALANSQIATLGNVLCQGGPLWRFEVATPRRRK